VLMYVGFLKATASPVVEREQAASALAD
jgi:hypothetical protein